MFVCVHVCVQHSQAAPGNVIERLCLAAVDSFSKKLHLHCSGLPSCLNGDLVTWCQLVLTGEANANCP